MTEQERLAEMKHLSIELSALLMDVTHIQARCHRLYREMNIARSLEEVLNDIAC